MPLQHEGLMRLLKCTDYEEGYFQVIDAEHHHIHDGVEWQYDHLFAAVADDGYARMRIYNNDGKAFHLQFFVSTEAKAYIKSYMNTTYSNDGTQRTAWNRSTCSTSTSVALVYTDPTINAIGSLRVNDMTGSGIGAGQVGGSSGSRVESILCTGTDFLVEIHNKATTAKDIVISARWYEVPEGV